jgi:hypothetical protein
MKQERKQPAKVLSQADLEKVYGGAYNPRRPLPIDTVPLPE